MIRDTWQRSLGGGLVEHFDHGRTYYTQYGVWMDVCAQCEELAPEDDMNDDGICPECVERNRENEELEEEDGPG